MSRSGRIRPRFAPARRVLPAVALLLIVAPSAVSAKQPGPWSQAVLEVGINSAQADGCPIESPNGLQLFIASTRPGAVGGLTDANDIWVARRSSIDAAWGVPGDGRRLHFGRLGDIWVSSRDVGNAQD
jgi:hypothetical protein